jgi:hypothetical protein
MAKKAEPVFEDNYLEFLILRRIYPQLDKHLNLSIYLSFFRSLCRQSSDTLEIPNKNA